MQVDVFGTSLYRVTAQVEFHWVDGTSSTSITRQAPMFYVSALDANDAEAKAKSILRTTIPRDTNRTVIICTTIWEVTEEVT